MHTYQVRQQDVAGNLSDDSAGLTVRIDTSVPAVPTAPRLLPADDSGTQGDRLTNVPQPRLTGTPTLATGEVLPTVQLVNAGGTIIGEAVAGANGVYTVQLNVPIIPNSLNFFTVRRAHRRPGRQPQPPEPQLRPDDRHADPADPQPVRCPPWTTPAPRGTTSPTSASRP